MVGGEDQRVAILCATHEAGAEQRSRGEIERRSRFGIKQCFEACFRFELGGEIDKRDFGLEGGGDPELIALRAYARTQRLVTGH